MSTTPLALAMPSSRLSFRRPSAARRRPRLPSGPPRTPRPFFSVGPHGRDHSSQEGNIVISAKTRPAPAGAWYLGLKEGDVAPRCILVGDRARVDMFGERLQGARVLSDKRGLRTMGGT